jgi:uncharacterized repeat protein (TIGR01451 family)
VQPYASRILLPASSPQLSIQASAPTAHANSPITIALTVRNAGSATANNLLITNTLPTNASYISGGTRVGSVLSWTVGSLAANSSTAVSFVITTTTTVLNQNYRVSASGCQNAVGNWFAIIPDPLQVFLPTMRR